MKSTLIMAVFMAFAFVGCQPKVQDLNVKNEKVTANSENWDITVNRSMFSSADANVNKRQLGKSVRYGYTSCR